MTLNHFLNGILQIVAAILLTIVFSKLYRFNSFLSFGYLSGLVLSASGLFFLPANLHPYWLGKIHIPNYLHYSLADWDSLIMGRSWHYFFITHSLLIPTILLMLIPARGIIYSFALGLSIGSSGHFIVEAFTSSLYTPVVFVANKIELHGYLSATWLFLNGVILFVIIAGRQRKV